MHLRYRQRSLRVGATMPREEERQNSGNQVFEEEGNDKEKPARTPQGRTQHPR